ncbi:protein late bloomer-like [Anastrepha obliqua]|uniref:protein late bloomer-like n=1 Tax=Anastrepha obliqua TaxID=95512 RepID=UPI002409D3C8|nr:protein late bloomer-like [Anastrepha obliqua]XP_054738768.1 protein late bloomer-like [Anastrepha obliqua]XP_054738769.1 protein late bloomer-like [Anastrepha obliqua]
MKVPFSSATLWKYVFLVLNCLIIVFDVLLISCGVISLGGAGTLAGAYTAASIGFLAMFIAFMGAMASVRQSLVLSWAYIVTTVLCIVLQTICMIAFGILKDDFTIMAAKRVQGIWDERPETQQEMDDIQVQHNCCGRDSPQDYLTDRRQTLPNSCCRWENCSDDENIFPKGCVDAATTFFNEQSDILILIILGLIAFQVLGVISAYYFTRSMVNHQQKREQIIINE